LAREDIPKRQSYIIKILLKYLKMNMSSEESKLPAYLTIYIRLCIANKTNDFSKRAHSFKRWVLLNAHLGHLMKPTSFPPSGYNCFPAIEALWHCKIKMQTIIERAITKPFDIIDELFQQKWASLDKDNLRNDWGIPEHFQSILQNHWHNVTLANC
jgi:hypothetical protein